MEQDAAVVNSSWCHGFKPAANKFLAFFAQSQQPSNDESLTTTNQNIKLLNFNLNNPREF